MQRDDVQEVIVWPFIHLFYLQADSITRALESMGKPKDVLVRVHYFYNCAIVVTTVTGLAG